MPTKQASKAATKKAGKQAGIQPCKQKQKIIRNK